MRYLADTHVLLWWLGGQQLPPAVQHVLTDSDKEVLVSAASGWEISIKRSLGKLEAPDDLWPIVEEEGFLHLPVNFSHGEKAGALPPLHRDPFDRMLVAQAQTENLTILTRDKDIPRYGVATIWN